MGSSKTRVILLKSWNSSRLFLKLAGSSVTSGRFSLFIPGYDNFDASRVRSLYHNHLLGLLIIKEPRLHAHLRGQKWFMCAEQYFHEFFYVQKTLK